MSEQRSREKLIRILVILGLAIISVCLVVYLRGPILNLIRGIIGVLGIIIIAGVVITFIERIQSRERIKK
ncbi:hypothetical protein DRZ78_04545 [Candidatus Aerophobetes bacterium]|uniref:Uncharacterized protein n=1 Tax=Aerophobetes bacterium TaxID=2030807 RepID=A0A662D2Y3_UNCAE|nr:MAG: hypothetical protein DRZ78_04545 [Candidatus Aerophobetes bacterium]